MPLSFSLSNRRINYLYNNFTRNNNEVKRKVYEYKKLNQSPGDFVNLVENKYQTVGEELGKIKIEWKGSQIQ